MQKRRILNISQVVSPYVPDTPGSVRARLIPQGLQEKGFEVRVFTPKYGCINERRNQLHEVIRLSGMNIIIDDSDHPLIIKVATLQPTRMQVYFIDNEDYFHHLPNKALETDAMADDNDERSMFFVRGVAETIKKLRWNPEVILCNGWITALAPLYLKRVYGDDPSLSAAKVVYAISDSGYLPKPLNAEIIGKLKQDDLSDDDLSILARAEEIGVNALSALAIANCDAIVIDTPDLSPELTALVEASGKPVLNYVDDPAEAVPAHIEFFNSLNSDK